MARNAQLGAPITGDGHPEARYPYQMEGNTPHGPQVAQAPPPQWPPYPVPARPARRWLPVAIIVAAIVVATAVVSAAIIMSGNKNGTSPAGPTTANAPGASPAPTAQAAATSSTCKAWKTTEPALVAIPGLPADWSWDTPNIDTYIGNSNAAVGKALNLFEPKIAATDPPDVVAAARSYITEKRAVMQKLNDHTYTTADGVTGNASLATLNQLCGVG
jgi:hypothetical protein